LSQPEPPIPHATTRVTAAQSRHVAQHHHGTTVGHLAITTDIRKSPNIAKPEKNPTKNPFPLSSNFIRIFPKVF
jgi:hypothetical protein